MPINHKYRKDFFIDKFERDVTPSVPLGEELYDVVSQYEGIVFSIQSGKQKFHGFGVTINWVKQSILFFLELPHWNNNVKPENKIYKEGGFIIIQNVVII